MAEMFTHKFGKKMTNLSRKCTKLLSRSSLITRQTFDDLEYPDDSNTHKVDVFKCHLERPSLRKAFS